VYACFWGHESMYFLYSAVVAVVAIHVHESRLVLIVRSLLIHDADNIDYPLLLHPYTHYQYMYTTTNLQRTTTPLSPRERERESRIWRARRCCVITSSFLRLALVRLRYYITLVFFRYSLIVGWPIRGLEGCKGGRGLVSRYVGWR
jgi:hypothetical protein